MRSVIWQRRALIELETIRSYIDQFHPQAAGHLFNRLLAAGNSLADYPERGRPVRSGRRELTAVWPYLIRYRVEADTVQILRVRHGARRADGI